MSRTRQTLGQEIVYWTAEIARTQDLREKAALRSKLLECKKIWPRCAARAFACFGKTDLRGGCSRTCNGFRKKGKTMLELKPQVLSNLTPKLNVVLVQNAEGLLKLQDFLKRTEGQPIGLDVETQVTNDFYDRRIRTIQVGNREEQYVLDLLGFTNDLSGTQGNYTMHPCYLPIFDILGPALESKSHIKCGANLSFDYTALRWSFGIRMWNLYSVDIAERVLQAGAISLKNIRRVFPRGYHGSPLRCVYRQRIAI